MPKQSFTSVGHEVARDAADVVDPGRTGEAGSSVARWEDRESWPRIRGGLMSIHLLALTTTVVIHAAAMLSTPSSPWGHVVLAILLVPLTLETTRQIVKSSQHVATQLRLASGMSLVTLGVLLGALSPTAWALLTCLIGGGLLLYGQATVPTAPLAEGSSVSSTQG